MYSHGGFGGFFAVSLQPTITHIRQFIHTLLDTAMSKICSKCREEKLISNFYKNRSTRDGTTSWCKACSRESFLVWSKTPAGIYSNIKAVNKCRNRKIVEITKDDFIEWYNAQPRFCVYCDIPEEHVHIVSEYCRSDLGRLTIDCKDNDAGYVRGNLVLACGRCNFLKSSLLTFDEMRFFAQRFLKSKWQEALTKGREE